MIELLELFQAGLTITAVGLAAVALPVTVITDADIPDLKPLIETLAKDTEVSK